jgi:hypothetical protein
LKWIKSQWVVWSRLLAHVTILTWNRHAYVRSLPAAMRAIQPGHEAPLYAHVQLTMPQAQAEALRRDFLAVVASAA